MTLFGADYLVTETPPVIVGIVFGILFLGGVTGVLLLSKGKYAIRVGLVFVTCSLVMCAIHSYRLAVHARGNYYPFLEGAFLILFMRWLLRNQKSWEASDHSMDEDHSGT